MKSKIYLVLFLMMTTLCAIGQPSNRQIVNQNLQWFSIASNLKIAKDYKVAGVKFDALNLYLEGQFRYADNLDPMQYQARTALEIVINKHWSVVPLGYVYTWNELYGKQPASLVNNEHRVWQQLIFKHKVSTLQLSHRLRVEERYIQVHSKDAEGTIRYEGYDNHQTRFRYRFMATLPFKGDKVSPKSFFAATYDEVFMSRGKSVTFHEPDQNRVFAGVGYQFNSHFNILAGPLYQMLIKSNGLKQENNVGVQAMVTYNLDFTRKAE